MMLVDMFHKDNKVLQHPPYCDYYHNNKNVGSDGDEKNKEKNDEIKARVRTDTSYHHTFQFE